jgi:hypothetical protein
MQLVQVSPALIICVWNSQFFLQKINKGCTIGTPDFLFWTQQYFIPTRISEQVGLFLLYTKMYFPTGTNLQILNLFYMCYIPTITIMKYCNQMSHVNIVIIFPP